MAETRKGNVIRREKGYVKDQTAVILSKTGNKTMSLTQALKPNLPVDRISDDVSRSAKHGSIGLGGSNRIGRSRRMK